MRLSTEEKNYVNKICAVTGKDDSTVREVLRGILVTAILEVYAGRNEFIVPYIGKIKTAHKNIVHQKKENSSKINLKLILETIPSKWLKREYKSVIEGNITSSAKFVRSQIQKNIRNMLDVSEDFANTSESNFFI